MLVGENREEALLAFAYNLSALQQVHIPNEGFGRQALDADFTLPPRARLARPYHSKLGLLLIMLDVEDLSGADGTNHSLQHRSAIANVSDLGVLREWHGFSVDAPDAYGEKCVDTSIAATIHRTSLSTTL
jgi:hypothetical protein